MDALEAILLGLVQGLTEFLPVSSSGHLAIASELLGQSGDGILFDIAVHLGTLVAVVFYYRRRIAELVVGVLQRRGPDLTYVGKLALATLPGVVAAVLAHDFLLSLFDRPFVVGWALLVTGCLLWTTRRTLPRADAPEPGWGAAFLIGCAQVCAIVPGISRSGTTVAVALALGVAPLAAAEFSFLMAVAAIGGAALFELPEALAASADLQAALWLGGAVAALSGLVALWLFVRLLRTQHFHRFAVYTWIAGAGFLAWLALRG